MQKLNTTKPNVGIINIPYISSTPISDTLEKNKRENPKQHFTVPKNKSLLRQNKLHKTQLAFDIGAIGISLGLLIGTIIKTVKKTKHP